MSACVTDQEEAMTVLQALVENTVMEVHVVGVEVGEEAEQLPSVELYAQYSSWVSVCYCYVFSVVTSVHTHNTDPKDTNICQSRTC